MTENVENLILEHMKRFQASLERIESKLGELTLRQTETHAAVFSLRSDRLDRIERWRELAN